jgi:hypothetical protein
MSKLDGITYAALKLDEARAFYDSLPPEALKHHAPLAAAIATAIFLKILVQQVVASMPEQGEVVDPLAEEMHKTAVVAGKETKQRFDHKIADVVRGAARARK